MLKTDNSPTPDAQILKDKMRLTVTNIYPAFQKKSGQHIRTSMYEEVPEESAQLKLIYSMYTDTDNSLGDIVRYLNEHQIKNLCGANWNTAHISEMLRNPVYVEADIDVYQFFQSQGANIFNPASDFTGYNACYLYKGTVSTSRKQSTISDKEIMLAPHKGFISSKIWLACRIRCLNNRQSAKTCKPKNSWLVGKVKCGNCGYALTIRKAKTKWERYFVCSQSGSRRGDCTGQAVVDTLIKVIKIADATLKLLGTFNSTNRKALDT